MVHAVEGRRIIVTGGAGFIGSHLVDRLLEVGAASVHVIDHLAFGSEKNLPLHNPRVILHKIDLGTSSPHDLLPIFDGASAVFHLAAEKHNASIGKPNQMLSSNIQGTLNVLEAAAQQGVKKVVFTSSLYAYGRIRGTEFREDEIVRPSTVYGISKVAGENLMSMYSQSTVETATIRYLFVYGPRQWANAGYKSVIVKNFERILSHQKPTVYGDGSQTLDYIYVSDAVDATIRTLTEAPNGSLFNVGSGVGTSIINLTHEMNTVADCSLPIQCEAPDWTEGSYRVADISKITETIGWKPTVSLREGLERTYEWLTSRNNNG